MQESSLVWDGFSALAQVGVSAPLTAISGVQANYRCISHRCHFTPQNNYCQLLQGASKELAVVYDDGKRRCWLVPKLSLLLHMSYVYASGCNRVPICNVPMVEAHTDAVDLIERLEALGDMHVHGLPTDALLFRTLMLTLNINLLSTVTSGRKSSRENLYEFEFREVVDGPGRGSCMKELRIKPPGKCWLDILNAVDAVVMCSEVGEVITAVGDRRNSARCDVVPGGFDYLAATLPCLTRLVESEGGELALNDGLGYFRVADRIWELSGDPFKGCEHDAGSGTTCWERKDLLQQIKRRKSRGLFNHEFPTSTRLPRYRPHSCLIRSSARFRP
jgi:hypothetical protein